MTKKVASHDERINLQNKNTQIEDDEHFMLLDYPLLGVAIPDGQIVRLLISDQLIEEINYDLIDQPLAAELEDISNSLVDLTLDDSLDEDDDAGVRPPVSEEESGSQSST